MESDKTNLKELLQTEIKSIRSIVDERDVLYNTRFKDSEVAVGAALLAQKTAVDAAFTASEKAIVKAEEAQKDYNQRSNEFRGQLDDQAKTLMPRTEVNVMVTSLESKIDANQKQIDELLLSKAKLEGKADQSTVTTALIISLLGIVIGVVAIILKFI